MSGKTKAVATLIAVFVPGILYANISAAAVQDTDYDGITNQSETSSYKTDPLRFDTDGDGFSDGVEVIAKSNPLDAGSTPLTVSEHKKLPLLERTDPITWYISRISGITAFIILTFVVLMGLVQTSKSLLKYKAMSFMTAQEVHRALAWLGAIAVFIHFSVLFFDQIFQLKVLEAVIPFRTTRPFKSALGFDFNLTVSLGIFAIYFIIILVATSELRKKVIPVRAWRLIHYISFITYALFLTHGILSGTDTKEWWMISIYVISFLLVSAMILATFFRERLFYPKGAANADTKPGSAQITK